MPHLVADRFLESAAAWMDLATGDEVRVRIAAAGSPEQQLVWNTYCASLANLRHPLVNALLDFGIIGTDRIFEAYVAGGAVCASGSAPSRLEKPQENLRSSSSTLPPLPPD